MDDGWRARHLITSPTTSCWQKCQAIEDAGVRLTA